jgi:putative ATPase
MLRNVISGEVFRERYGVPVSDEALELMASAADGDARRALNLLEQLTGTEAKGGITGESVRELVQSAPLLYDRSGEEHYNLISALHKSMRSGDPDASLYWLGRMILSGEDPLYIGRRMIRFATEDIGLADPSALTVAMRAVDAYRFLGSPEGDLALAEAAVYLSIAPKSNSIYQAWKLVSSAVAENGSLPVPLHLRNAPTKLMKQLDYGKGYQYVHNRPGGIVTHGNLPEELLETEFYRPLNSGREKKIRDELARWKELRNEARKERE